MRFWLACVTLEALLALAPRPALAEPALTFETLLESFARVPGVEADFREEKHTALLEAPLVTSGRLAYCPPGLLLRHIHHPTAATVLVRQGHIYLQQGARRRQLDLSGQPAMRHLVESLIYLLAGDGQALNRLYRARFTLHPGRDGANGWQLVLTPRSRELQRWLREVTLRGQGVRLTTMRIQEASGDQTVTTFAHVNTSRTWTSQEQEQLFRPAPR